jgi:hypothetical protein
MPRALRWCLVVILYFSGVVYFLHAATAGSFCAYCGPSPGLWWGDDPPRPGPQEYFRNKAYYDFLFLVPYLIVGLALTGCGCAVARTMAQRFKTSRSLMTASTVVTGALTLLAATASDAGSLLGLWQAPSILLHDSHDLYFLVMVLSRLCVPTAVFSGLVALACAKRLL